MKKTALYMIWLLLAMGVAVVQSCSSDAEDNGKASGTMHRRVLTMDLSLGGFTETSSRATSSFSNGDKVYIDFGGVIGTAEYNGGQWTIECPDDLQETDNSTCSVVYIQNASSEGSQTVSLSTESIVYEATGTYTNTIDKLSVTASLSPVTSRVHFRGESGTIVAINGLKYFQQFNISDFTFTSSTENLALTVNSDGYTDYVYCVFASSSRMLVVVNDGNTYTRPFASDVLQVGHSGYIDIPTVDSYAGWDTDSRTYVTMDGNDYDGDGNWNQLDPEQDKNTGISGSDYDEDGNWNQPDPEQDKNIGISGNDYDGDGNWNQPDPEQDKDASIFGSDYDSDSDWNQKDPEPDINVDTPVNGYDGDENWNATVHNGHEYVDLGLSVKWATMNVGALKPEGYGQYFAWGEIYSKTEYSWATYKDNPSGDGKTFTKYATNKKTVLDPEDDVAHVKWGGNWRMPTEAERDELCTNCTWTWTTQHGVDGFSVKGPNGKSIFLPAAGFYNGTNLNNAGSWGRYWLSSLNGSDSSGAYYLSFYSDYVSRNSNARYCGRSVRPVCP